MRKNYSSLGIQRFNLGAAKTATRLLENDCVFNGVPRVLQMITNDSLFAKMLLNSYFSFGFYLLYKITIGMGKHLKQIKRVLILLSLVLNIYSEGQLFG